MGFLVNTGKRSVNISIGYTQHKLHRVLLVRRLAQRSLNAPTELEIHRSELRHKYLNSTKYTITLKGVNFVNKASLHDLCTYLQYCSVYRKTIAILDKQATLHKSAFPHTANLPNHVTRLIPW
jgi:sRNA-binding carbon storage regulator CsrA